MSINSKVELCNMALSHLGNYGTISDIDTPKTDKELTFSLWYDIARQAFLKQTMPNFSIGRRYVSQVSETPPYPFKYSYEYPNDCLKLLGIGSVEDKQNDYTVENNRIYTDVLYSDGMPIRFIADITDVTKMSPEFKVGFSMYLASVTALEITQDLDKVQMLKQMLPSEMSALSGLNAQENRPIRISTSRFKEARTSGFPRIRDKR